MALIILLGLSTLRFVGKIVSFVMRSFIKLIVILVFILIGLYSYDLYKVKQPGSEDEKSQGSISQSIESIAGTISETVSGALKSK